MYLVIIMLIVSAIVIASSAFAAIVVLNSLGFIAFLVGDWIIMLIASAFVVWMLWKAGGDDG